MLAADRVFEQAMAERRVGLVRQSFILAGAVMLVYTLWDMYIDPPSWRHTLPLRMGFAFFALSLYLGSRRASFARYLPEILSGFSWIAIFVLSVLLSRVHEGFIWGLPSLLLPVIGLTATLPYFRLLLYVLPALILLPNFVMILSGASERVLVNANCFLVVGSLISLVYGLRLHRQLRTTYDLEQHLERLASIDSLTGLPNRRSFFERSAIEVERNRRYGVPLALVMVDIDHFKRINDRYGHETGDRALVAVAEVLKSGLRQADFAARLGGEEFCLLLPETPPDAAQDVAERLRLALATAPVAVGEEALTITASFGVANLGLTADSLEDCLARADAALYHAKAGGRNRVEVAGSAR